MRVNVRDATAADTAAIHALYAAQVRDTFNNYEYLAPDLEEMRRRIAAVTEAGYPWLVAEFDDALDAIPGASGVAESRESRFAGYAYATSFRSRPGYRWTVENAVYVHPRAQRHGVGKALMGALIERCTTLGYRQMIAVIGDAENAASIALHRALGFETVGVFRGIGYKAVDGSPGRWLDNLQMQRVLGVGSATPP
jgi:L-amino acid N-acyltransferase YncA